MQQPFVYVFSLLGARGRHKQQHPGEGAKKQRNFGFVDVQNFFEHNAKQSQGGEENEDSIEHNDFTTITVAIL